MQKIVIEPHFRLQEWIAEEKHYFTAGGLDYEFREHIRATGGRHHDKGGDKIGAYQSFEAGRQADVSCACHWTVNVAASSGHGRLYADLYSVAPAGIFVPATSPVRGGVSIRGSSRAVEAVSAAAVDKYSQTRVRDSQIGRGDAEQQRCCGESAVGLRG